MTRDNDKWLYESFSPWAEKKKKGERVKKSKINIIKIISLSNFKYLRQTKKERGMRKVYFLRVQTTKKHSSSVSTSLTRKLKILLNKERHLKSSELHMNKAIKIEKKFHTYLEFYLCALFWLFLWWSFLFIKHYHNLTLKSGKL